MSERLDASWERRKQTADEWNRRMANGEIHPSFLRRSLWELQACTPSSKYRKLGGTTGTRRAALEKRWREVDGMKHPSLAWALNDVFGIHFWAGGLFKVCPNQTPPRATQFQTLTPGYRRYVATYDTLDRKGHYQFRKGKQSQQLKHWERRGYGHWSVPSHDYDQCLSAPGKGSSPEPGFLHQELMKPYSSFGDLCLRVS